MRRLLAALLVFGCAHDLGECRRRIVAVSIEPCVEVCAGPPGPPTPALGIALMFDGSVQCRCEMPETPIPGTLSVSAPACPAGCTEARVSCYVSCAEIFDLDRAYCERTCAVTYSRCEKRCARAAKEER